MEKARIEDLKFHTISAASLMYQCLLAMRDSSSRENVTEEESNLV